MDSWQSFMSLHLKLLDIDHPLTFEESKLRQIEAHALTYLSTLLNSSFFLTSQWQDPISSGQIEKELQEGHCHDNSGKKIKRGFYCKEMNTLTCSNLRLSFTTIEAKKKDCNLGMKKIGFFSKLFVTEKKAILKLMLIFSEVG